MPLVRRFYSRFRLHNVNGCKTAMLSRASKTGISWRSQGNPGRGALRDGYDVHADVIATLTLAERTQNVACPARLQLGTRLNDVLTTRVQQRGSSTLSTTTSFPLGTQRCCDVESTSMMLIQRRNNILCAQWVLSMFPQHLRQWSNL